MNEGTTTRILLVDDHPMMRRGLRDLLELEERPGDGRQGRQR